MYKSSEWRLPDSSIQSNRHLLVSLFKGIVQTQMKILSPCACLLLLLLAHAMKNRRSKTTSDPGHWMFTVWTINTFCDTKKEEMHTGLEQKNYEVRK